MVVCGKGRQTPALAATETADQITDQEQQTPSDAPHNGTDHAAHHG